MKLLVQADDYGISPAVAHGILHGIEDGIIRNTGVFTNMPWSRECISWIRAYVDIVDVGIDLNITTGAPLCDPRDIPTLVGEDGLFHSSSASRRLDAELGCEHVDPRHAYREFRSQVERYCELMGAAPAYIHAHAYTTPGLLEVQRNIAAEYGAPYASDVWLDVMGLDVMGYRIPWYKKPATLENQAESSLVEYVTEHGDDLLRQDVAILAGHMGYVDRELMDLSSYTILRVNDLAGVTDPSVLAWVDRNDVETIRYRDLVGACGSKKTGVGKEVRYENTRRDR